MTKLSEEVIGYLDDLKFPPTKGTITYWSRQIALLEADCRHYNDESNTALNSVAELEDRIKELEAELTQCLDCCKRVGELEDALEMAITAKEQAEIIRQYIRKTHVGKHWRKRND